MTRAKISQLDAAAANNTDINAVNVAEGCPPSGINNAIREMGAMLKRMDNGTDHLTDPNITGSLDVDNININGNTISSTDTNGNVTVDPNGTGQINLSANVDVTGTVTADGLTVDGDASLNGTAVNLIFNETDTTDLNTRLRQSGALFSVATVNDSGSSPKAHILVNNSLGDIAFYDSTGTTQGLLWDASTQRLGLGTTAPVQKLDVYGGNIAVSSADTYQTSVNIDNTDTGGRHFGLHSTGSVNTAGRFRIYDYDANAERMTITAAGGIEIPNQNAINELTFTGTEFTNVASNTTSGFQLGTIAASHLSLLTNNTGRLHITSSGYVGIGGSETSVFTGAGEDMKFVVIGDDSATNIVNNSNAGIAIVNTNQTAGNLAGLHFARADTDDNPNYAGASIVAQFPEAQVTGQYPKGDLAFLTSTATNSAPSEKMRLTAAGNVGIGVVPESWGSAFPSVLQVGASASLTTSGGDNARLFGNVWYDGTNYKRITSGFAHQYEQTGGTHRWSYAANGAADSTISFSEAMRIDSGNVLVGTTTAKGNYLTVGSSSVAGSSGHFDRSGDGGLVRFYRSGAEVGYISVTSSSTAYNTSSDYRLKTDVTYNWDATSRLKQLKPARFAWIADGDDAVPVDGFLAHEVQDIVPEAIHGTKDAMREEEYEVTPAVEATYDDDGNILTEAVPAVMGTRSVPDYQGIDQSKLAPLLTKALIEAVEKIEQLEARIAALEAN